ncbi:MAG: 50S ribosomal protein L1, partial [Gammaproteobacteria bacterium]
MMAISKRVKSWKDKIDEGKLYAVTDALQLLKECSTVKFDESVEVAVNLGVDAKKSDQAVRGASVLPKGTGKTVRIAVFAQGEQAEAAKAAGADVVGFDDLAERMQAGEINFDVVIATPDAMPVVSKLGKVLGPRGLMPNPKVGTVSADAGQAVENAKAGQVRYRTDKNGIIHCSIGKVSFDVEALIENLEYLLSDLVKA